jgi:vitamin B12 transporter
LIHNSGRLIQYFMKKHSNSDTLVCFKRWTRKKYAILLSLSKLIKIGVLCLSYSLLNRLPFILAQPNPDSIQIRTLEIEEVEITSKRKPAYLTEFSRLVAVIQNEDIEKSGIQSFQDILEYASNIDIRQRGNLGVQSDASIRGGSFDHVMILVNGINLSDPQSGHLSLDLPVDVEIIERIEILEGSNSHVLGAGAFTGAINIITRSGDLNSISASQVIGDYGYLRTNLCTGQKTGLLHHLLSFSSSSSKGYTENTDFKLQNFYYRSDLTHDKILLDFQAGYQHKHFGAGEFYSPRFPNQYEKADVWFSSIRMSTGDKIRFIPSIYWRQRKDHFMLERKNPEFYQNFHRNNVYGSQLKLIYNTRHLTSIIGLDARSENILSNNIGLDNPHPVPVKGEDTMLYTQLYGRTNFSYFQEHNLNIEDFSISGGIMINWNTDYSDKPYLFPGFDASYKLFPAMQILVSFNRALHLPTFTDLFYKDPVNQGNINLSPNRITSFEGGVKYSGNIIKGNVVYFQNAGKDIIDWLWSYVQNRYSPVNIKKHNVTGLEANLSLCFTKSVKPAVFLKSVNINYMFMDIKKSTSDSVSKYYNLKNKLSLMIRLQMAGQIEASWNISYQDRFGDVIGYNLADNKYFVTPYKPYWLIDATFRRSFRCMDIYTEISNILDTEYIDAGSAIQPGRWFKIGILMKIKTSETESARSKGT